MMTVSALGPPTAWSRPTVPRGLLLVVVVLGTLTAACTPSGLPPESPKEAPANPSPLASVIVDPAPAPEQGDAQAVVATAAASDASDAGTDATEPRVAPQP